MLLVRTKPGRVPGLSAVNAVIAVADGVHDQLGSAGMYRIIARRLSSIFPFTVTEVYHDTNEIRATALELSLPPNKVKKLLVTADMLKYIETEQIQSLLQQGKTMHRRSGVLANM